jgi:hypothetical protein
MPEIPDNKTLNKILEEIVLMRSNLPNGELKVIQSSIEDLKRSQAYIKDDVSEVKRRLLDPENGIIVRLNENSKYIREKQEMEDYYEEIIDQHKELISWKNTMTKVMWIIFTALIGILTKMMFFTES